MLNFKQSFLEKLYRISRYATLYKIKNTLETAHFVHSKTMKILSFLIIEIAP